MNSTKVTGPVISDWAKFATIQYREAMERTLADPEFIKWAERVEARQANDGSDMPQWSRDTLASSWLDKHRPDYAVPPVERPAWATELDIYPMPDGDTFEWNISYAGKIGDAEVTQYYAIHDDAELTVMDVSINLRADDTVSVFGSELDRVIDALTQVRAALNA